MSPAELGVNFSHIRAKSLAVLNPFRRVDERIMDDADLAGPFIFFLCFGTFLLFVSQTSLFLFGSVDLQKNKLTDTWVSQGSLNSAISMAWAYSALHLSTCS